MQKVKEQQNAVKGTISLFYWAVLMTLDFVIRIDLAKASVALRGFLTLDPAALASFCKYLKWTGSCTENMVNVKLLHTLFT